MLKSNGHEMTEMCHERSQKESVKETARLTDRDRQLKRSNRNEQKFSAYQSEV